KFSSSNIIIAGLYLVHNIHHGKIVELQFHWVNYQLVLFFKTAKGSHFRHTGNCLQGKLDVPVLQCTLFAQVHFGGVEMIPENMSYSGTIRTERRRDALWQ